MHILVHSIILEGYTMFEKEVVDGIIAGIKKGMSNEGIELTDREHALVEASARSTIMTIAELNKILIGGNDNE